MQSKNKIQQCFKILNIAPGASITEASRAYKNIVKVWHPDRFNNNPALKKKAEEKLKEINAAYSEIKPFLLSKPSFKIAKVLKVGKKTITDSIKMTRYVYSYLYVKFQRINFQRLLKQVAQIAMDTQKINSQHKQNKMNFTNKSENKAKNFKQIFQEVEKSKMKKKN